jgi:hypothetical protein
MKRSTVLLFALFLLGGMNASAQERHRPGGDGGWGNGGSRGDQGDQSAGGWGGHSQDRDRSDSDQSNRTDSHQSKRPQGRQLQPKPGRNREGGGYGRHHFTRDNETGAGRDSARTFRESPRSGMERGSADSRRLREMGIGNIPKFDPRKKILNTDRSRSVLVRPSAGPKGVSLHAAMIAPNRGNGLVVRARMEGMVRNRTLAMQLTSYNRMETRRGHYYWHRWNGTDYCHYCDPWGYDWYGWYWGDTCFWARWYDDDWWWYDPAMARWCYWNDGWWWWRDPADIQVVYVYDDGRYVPAGEESVPAPENSPSAEYRSPDGTRTVKIVDGDAFLYDTGDHSAENKPVYLGSDVQKVQFSSTGDEKSLQVLLTFKDGSFKLFDSEGNPYGQASGGSDD